MNRIECIEAFARLRGNAIVIVSPGLAAHELHHAQHDDATIYNMDMPYASPMCLGIALACPDERVVAIEGDGSMLMALGAITTIGRYHPANLTIVVFRNGAYLTTGDGSVRTAQIDFAGMAQAAGIEHARTVRELDAFEEAMRRALTEPGPSLIAAEVDGSDRQAVSRGEFESDIVEQAVLFQKEMRKRRNSTTAVL